MNTSVSSFWKRLALVCFAAIFIVGCSKKSSEEYIASANSFIEAKDYDAAIIELKNAVQQDPENALLRFELGKVYLETKDFVSAEKELRRARGLGHPASQVIPLLSKAFQRTGAHNAMVDIDHASSQLTASERVEVGFYKVQSLVEIDEVEQARALITELQTVDTQSVYKGLVSVIEMILDQDLESALARVKELRDQSPLNRDALVILARLNLRLNQFDDAIAAYADYISKFPEDTTTKFMVASLLTELGRSEEAEVYIDDLLALSANNPMLNQLKGIALAEQGKFESSFEYLKKAIEAGRTDPVLRLVAGYTAYELKDYDYANSQLSLIASDLPNDHPGLKLLAASQLQLGLSDDATSVLSRVDTVTQDDAQLFSRAGFELLKAGNVADARSILERTKPISEDSDDLLRLGVLQLSMNNIEGIINLEEAVAKAPDSITAQTTLATAYLATNQIDKAQALAKEWKASSPNDVRPYILEADLDIRARDFVAADAEYDAALLISPKNPDVLLAKARLFAQQQDIDGASNLVQMVLDDDPSHLGALAMQYMIERERGNSSAVVEQAEQLLLNAPQNELLRFVVARMQTSEQQFGKALDTLSVIKDEVQSPKDYWLIKGQALLQSNNLAESTQHYEKWFDSFPYDKDALLGLLLIHDLTGDADSALEATQVFLAKREDAQISILESHFYSLKGDVNASRDILNEAPEGAQELPFVQGIIARNFISESNFTEAMQPAMLAYEEKPNLRNLLMIIQSYEGSGEADAAYTVLTQHTERFSNDPRAKMLLAERQIGRDVDAAISEYESLIDENQNNFVAINNLAYLQLQKGNLEQAERLAERAVELQPQNPATSDTLAQVHVAKKDYDEALDIYAKIINNSMRNEEIYLNYVETLLVAGNSGVAERRLNERQYQQPQSIARIVSLAETYGVSVKN